MSSNEDGVHPGNFTRDTYEFVQNFVDPEDIALALEEVYPSEVLEAGYVEMAHVRMGLESVRGVTVDEAVARQFIAIHQRDTKPVGER
jgi:hypothetical protein